jgi:hypothetical protein
MLVMNTDERQCHLNVNWDPHASEVYINMSEDEPEVLNMVEAGGSRSIVGKNPGDARAVTVTCDKAPKDDRTQPIANSPLPPDEGADSTVSE